MASISPGSAPSEAPTVHEIINQSPPWDRAIDIVCHKYKHGDPRPGPADAFNTSRSLFHAKNEETTGYFHLPDSVRFKIWQHLIQTHKPVTLSLASFTKDVWPSDTFMKLESALAPIQSYLAVSSSVRADILLTFLVTSKFHVVFSPYVNKQFSPLATLWLNKYVPYIRSLILELDMTKLGLGPSVEAAYLRPGLGKIGLLLQDFAQRQGMRQSPMELVLLCRRFHGWRDVILKKAESTVEAGRKSKHSMLSQQSDASFESSLQTSHESSMESDDPQPIVSKYCPDECLLICNHLLRLDLLALRMCGFGEKYTLGFVANLFPGERFAYRVAPSGAWRTIRGQRSWIDIGEGNMILDDHDTESIVSFQGPFIPPPPIQNSDGTLCLPGFAKWNTRAKCTTVSRWCASSLSEGHKKEVVRLLDKYGMAKEIKDRVLSIQATT